MNERRLPFDGDDKNLITEAGDRMKSSFLKVLKEVLIDEVNTNPGTTNPSEQVDSATNHIKPKP